MSAQRLANPLYWDVLTVKDEQERYGSQTSSLILLGRKGCRQSHDHRIRAEHTDERSQEQRASTKSFDLRTGADRNGKIPDGQSGVDTGNLDGIRHTNRS